MMVARTIVARKYDRRAISHTGAPFRRMYPSRLLAVNAFMLCPVTLRGGEPRRGISWANFSTAFGAGIFPRYFPWIQPQKLQSRVL